MTKHIIYLAAGNSRRFGSNKLLAQFHGKPLYRHSLDMLQAVCKENTDLTLTVVTQYDEIAAAARKRGIFVVCSKECRQGISCSIRAGLERIEQMYREEGEACRKDGRAEPDERDYIMFVVADQPYLSEKTVLKLLSCADGMTETASVICKNRPGNPTLFSMKLKGELRELTGDQGGRKVIRQHQCRYVEAEEERELWDIDTAEDICREL